MNKFIVLLMCGLAIINPVIIHAKDFDLPQVVTPENEESVGEALSPLRKGQKAPFSGVLLSPAAIANITVKLSSFDDEIQLEINKIKAEAAAEAQLIISQKKAEFEADMAIIKANLESLEKENVFLQEELEEEKRNRPSRGVWFSLGVLAGVGITVTILFASKQLGI